MDCKLQAETLPPRKMAASWTAPTERSDDGAFARAANKRETPVRTKAVSSLRFAIAIHDILDV
jgi:hypothetical protein